MRNPDRWAPSKFVFRRGRLAASRDLHEVSPASRLIGDIQAEVCERLLREHARGRLIDLGCGKCPLYVVYRDLVSETVCIDWPGTLHKSPFLDLEADLNRTLSLESASCDTVLLTDVLEHIRKPDALISEIARILRPGGKLLLTVPFFYWLHEQPHDFFRYTRYALEEFCRAPGLAILELSEYGGAPEILLDILGKQLASRPRVAGAFSALATWLTGTRLSRRISRISREKFPLGYCLVATKS